MAKSQITARLADLVRTDLYDENEVEKIVNAQNSRSAQSIPTTTFEDASGKTIHVYAFTTTHTMKKDTIETAIAGIEGVNAVKLLDQAMFYDRHPVYSESPNRFAWYKPKIRGSIRLTFEKKK